MSRTLKVLLVLLALLAIGATLLDVPLAPTSASRESASPRAIARLRAALADERALAARLPALRAQVQRLPAPLRNLAANTGKGTVGLLRELGDDAQASGVGIAQATFGPMHALGPARAVTATLLLTGSLSAQAAFLRAVEDGREFVAVREWVGTAIGGQVTLQAFYR